MAFLLFKFDSVSFCGHGQLNLSAGKDLVQGSATQKKHGLQGQGFLKTETFQEKFEFGLDMYTCCSSQPFRTQT